MNSNRFPALARVVRLDDHRLSSLVGWTRHAAYTRYSLRDPEPDSVANQETLCRTFAARRRTAGLHP